MVLRVLFSCGNQFVQVASQSWFRDFRDEFVDSWSQSCKRSTAHFTASRKQLKVVVNLTPIRHRRQDEEVSKKSRIRKSKNFNILLSKAVKYIQFEEMMVASMIIYRTCERKGWLEETKRKTNGSVGRIGRPPHLDTETTNPLIFLRSTLFKSVSIRCSAKRRSSFPKGL